MTDTARVLTDEVESAMDAERFTRVVGETPARYVAQVRMHHARQWLSRDKARIGVVAQRLGYDSEASFSRAFKRIMGVPPSHYYRGHFRGAEAEPANETNRMRADPADERNLPWRA